MIDIARDPRTTPVIVSAVRTPIGKYLGALAPLSAPDLGAIAIREAVRRAVDERWLLVSTHDPFVPWGFVSQDGKGVRLEAAEG